MELYKPSQLTPQILAQIKALHYQTRHLAQETLAGQYRSAFRGTGMEFEEVRAYTPGDDVRAIDWKVTARMNSPFIKTYREERELTVMIAVDSSSSTLTSTSNLLRENLIAQIGAILTLVALKNNDKVGLVTFSEELESYHPPRKASNAVWRIIQEVLGNQEVDIDPKTSKSTNLQGLFSFLSSVLKRKAIIFILSDFFDSGYDKALGILAKKHDVTAILVGDPADLELPSVGLVNLRDPETQQEILVDTTCQHFRSAYRQRATQHSNELKKLFAKYKIETLELQTDRPFLPELKKYFSKKKSRH